MSDALQNSIIDVLASNLPKVSKDAITPESTLDDLGVKSIEMVEVLYDLEEHFDITIPPVEDMKQQGIIEQLDNVADLCTMIARLSDNH